MESDLKAIADSGVWSAFDSLTTLRAWKPYLDADPRNDKINGTQALAKTLDMALADFAAVQASAAAALTHLLALKNPRGRGRLTGEGGLRHNAGKAYGVKADQYWRVYQADDLKAFATFLETWTPVPMTKVDDGTVVNVTFDVMARAASDLLRLLSDFSPQLVITMSGPGSFAATYTMQHDTRDVPVVMAVTFPARDRINELERAVHEASARSEGIHIRTPKWSIYLPGLVRHLPQGHRIALVDDRVISGESQSAARAELEQLGYNVRCAALFSRGPVPIPDLIVSCTYDRSFQMPWGSERGRRPPA